jgi:glyoxylase-like metal-dependent hydrolase (beta-lactamase superfamily II)
MYNVNIFRFSPIAENTYVLYNNKKQAIIIDPGCYGDADETTLKSFIDSQELVPMLLLNTHCHLDHVFGNKFVFETWGLIPHIHRLEQPVLDYASVAGLMWNLPFDNYTGEIIYLEEGETTGLVGDPLEVLFTPGHSPGSISFYSAEGGFVISGDVLFRGSVGRTDLPGCNSDDLIKSISQKLYALPNETIVYSGHGGTTTIGEEKQSNPYVKG